MQEELLQIDHSAWQLHYQKLHYEGDWSAIPLRSVNGVASNIFISPEANPQYKNTIFLDKSTYFKEVLSTFKCTLLAVRLLKLNAGALIKEHKDADLCYEKGEIRIHIPVVTNEQVAFYLDKEKMILHEGECWYMNFNLLHSLNNKSKVNRVHLVIDAIVNDWVHELFAQPSITKKEMDEPGYDDKSKMDMIAGLRELNTETSNRIADELEASIISMGKADTTL